MRTLGAGAGVDSPSRCRQRVEAGRLRGESKLGGSDCACVSTAESHRRGGPGHGRRVSDADRVALGGAEVTPTPLPQQV